MRAAKLGALAACLCTLASGSAGADTARIVILPVVVHSAATDPAYVSQGLADMLSARLEQTGSVEVVRVDDPASATSRLGPAISAGRKAGGDYVLFGSFTQFGDGASLDIQCAPLESTAPARSIFIQAGTIGEIIPKLDELADKVARYLGGPEAEAAEVAAAASGSNGAGPEKDLGEIQRRLDALERAVFPPVAASTEGDAEAPAEEALPES